MWQITPMPTRSCYPNHYPQMRCFWGSTERPPFSSHNTPFCCKSLPDTGEASADAPMGARAARRQDAREGQQEALSGRVKIGPQVPVTATEPERSPRWICPLLGCPTGKWSSASETCTGIHRTKFSPGSPGRPPGYHFGTG